MTSEDKTTDPVALFDQMGALLNNCAVMFGQYQWKCWVSCWRGNNMKKYYAKDSAVASIEVTGGRLNSDEKAKIAVVLNQLGLVEVTHKKYLEIQSKLPPTKKHVRVSIGGDGQVVTTEE
eukprot:GHVU01146789.1.p1 GENE.GHVU01146789.1~~GHVU01146789.1.p1  ORF type:complete len:120 (+),score=17.72 GHVU01146789.1:1372-1731(+)